MTPAAEKKEETDLVERLEELCGRSELPWCAVPECNGVPFPCERCAIAGTHETKAMREAASVLRLARARIEELEAALEPFAKAIHEHDEGYSHNMANISEDSIAEDISWGDLRRASSVKDGKR